ncbi:3-dehydroquinate synthase [Salipaludibacillus sp. LMS25]|jgi:3-dehydroquinate synthase|uniref:3-dehydroquinate synthase n=1 Tax=Salipaludibacillus sp. LMS25 TaxID=2924031 RepID=UPI0020D05530|nr:3-dehydroquinate synthase [Salipaludibacillus sp. LMS25]UTR14636.1 3-dehydroquinate synthase [Salipaludibacillus sp. LMS25]
MQSPTLTIASRSHEYPVYIDQDIRFHTFNLINAHLAKPASAYMIVADKTVADYYLKDVLSSFPETIKPYVSLIPSGEASKSFEMYHHLLTQALENGLDRQSVIIALGGGVTGDLAGFTAATYMRGIQYVQMPTTLLAHDSSVGGKTGINHAHGKNLIGAFHPPAAVIYDSQMLRTLPIQEWRSGFAEVIKHGFIAEPELLEWLERNITDLSHIPPEKINELLERSIRIKAHIVEEDEKEQGVRAYLNFGHTLGHSIEAEVGYGHMTHGEAVAIGMSFALKLSERLLGSKLSYDRILDYMKTLGYSLQIPSGCDHDQLIVRMRRDKKSSHNDINYVLLHSIGQPQLVKVSEKDILRLLEEEGHLR